VQELERLPKHIALFEQAGNLQYTIEREGLHAFGQRAEIK